MLDAVRRHFDSRGFLEVETPILVPSPGLEPHLEAFETGWVGPDRRVRRRYLHTSPEYGMKKLLGRGVGPCYQVARVFRNGEASEHHAPEFTMLEFYRSPGDWEEVAADTVEIVHKVAAAVGGTPPARVQTASVQTLFLEAGLPDPLAHDDAGSFVQAWRDQAPVPGDTYADAFFRAFFEGVEPRLPPDQLTVVTGYPASMAALAELDPADPRQALRFEVFWGPVELGNAFQELCDPVEQRARFEADLRERRATGRPVYPVDEGLLGALVGVRRAAGIAVGLDRLLMCCLGRSRLADVMPWPLDPEGPGR